MDIARLRSLKLITFGVVILTSGFATTACQSTGEAGGGGDGSADSPQRGKSAIAQSRCFSESIDGSRRGNSHSFGIGLRREHGRRISGISLLRNDIEPDSLQVTVNGRNHLFMCWNEQAMLQLFASANENATVAVTYCTEEKAAVCHRPPGNPRNEHTINVGGFAVRAHLAHGDSLGRCAGEVPAPEPTPTPTPIAEEPNPEPTPTPVAEEPTPVVIQPLPPTVPPAFSIFGMDAATSMTTAFIIWYTPGFPSTSQIIWGPTPQLGSVSAVDTTLVEDHSLTIGGLIPNTTYYFQAVSTDANGHTTYSQVISKTTKP